MNSESQEKLSIMGERLSITDDVHVVYHILKTNRTGFNWS